jgi:hypothetical protein
MLPFSQRIFLLSSLSTDSRILSGLHTRLLMIVLQHRHILPAQWHWLIAKKLCTADIRCMLLLQWLNICDGSNVPPAQGTCSCIYHQPQSIVSPSSADHFSTLWNIFHPFATASLGACSMQQTGSAKWSKNTSCYHFVVWPQAVITLLCISEISNT